MTEANVRSREDQLIAFFVNQCSGQLGRTRLMKLVYLADYEARRYMGRPMSEIDYVWHHYGPYDDGLPDRLESLKSDNVILEEQVAYPTGQVGYLYRRGPTDVHWTFTAAELEILGYVCDQYSTVQLAELLEDIVYETEPMLKAREENARGQRLDMDMVNNDGNRGLVVPFLELLNRRHAAQRGEVIPHAEVVRRLNESLDAA